MSKVMDINEIRQKKSKKKILFRSLIFAFLAALMILFVIFNDKINEYGFNNFLGTVITGNNAAGFPVSYLGGNGKNIFNSPKGITLETDTYLFLYNTSGGVSHYIQHGFSNLRLDYYKNDQLMYDRGGKELFIYRKDKQIFKKTFEEQIVEVKYAADGKIAVVLDSGSFVTKLIVLDRNYNQIFEWYSSEYQAFSVDFTDNSKQVAVACCGVNAGSVVTVVYFLDLSAQKEISHVELANNMAYTINFKENNDLFVVGDYYSAVINPKGEIKRKVNYDGRKLISYDNKPNKNTLLVFDETKSNNTHTVSFFDMGGKEVFSAQVNNNIRDISAADGSFAVLTDKEIKYYDINATKKEKTKEYSDAFRVCLKDDQIYVLSFSQLDKISFR